jgi:peroxiredoxin Q/BCP
LLVLEQGNKAPDFALPDQNGDPVKLSDLKGQTVVLFFYPRADTAINSIPLVLG